MLLLFYISIFSNIFGQGKLLVKPEAWTERLILAGNVEVMDSIFARADRDSVRQVRYEHFIIADYQQDTIFYCEIFKSAAPHFYLKNSYKFSFEKETLRFYNEKEYLNFPELGKLLFLCKKGANDEKGNLDFALRKLDSDRLKNYPAKDSSFFGFIRLLGSEVEHSQNLRDSLAKEHWVILDLKEKIVEPLRPIYPDNFPVQNLKTTPMYQNTETVIRLKASLNNRTGLYDRIEILRIREQSKSISKKGKRAPKQKVITKSIYKKTDTLPDDILKQLD